MADFIVLLANVINIIYCSLYMMRWQW